MANLSMPALRLALGTAVLYKVDAWDHFHVFAVAVMHAIKVAWESKNPLVPIPLEKRMDFDVEIYGYTPTCQ